MLSCLFIAPLKDDDTVTRWRSSAVFDSLVAPAAQAIGYFPTFCLCGAPGTIFEEVVDKILRARVIVADLTTANGNVCYELAYAHSKGIATVLLIQEGHKPPFDVQTMNMIRYNYGDRRTLMTSVPELIEHLRVCPPPHLGARNPLLNAERGRKQSSNQPPPMPPPGLTSPPFLPSRIGQQPPPQSP